MKIAGLIFILLAPSLIGFMKAEDYIEENNILRSFITLISFIKREISSYLTPQREIYTKFYDKHLYKCGFLDELKNSTSDTPLLSALSLTKERLNLRAEPYELIYEFASLFGTLSEKEEMDRCDKLVSELEEIYKKNKEENREKIRLCRTVGCMTGIGLLLIMW